VDFFNENHVCFVWCYSGLAVDRCLFALLILFFFYLFRPVRVRPFVRQICLAWAMARFLFCYSYHLVLQRNLKNSQSHFSAGGFLLSIHFYSMLLNSPLSRAW
jgi:hypothetical protein